MTRLPRMPVLQVVAAGLTLVSTTEAANFYGIPSTNPPNFLAYYPDIRSQLLNITLNTCAAPLKAYNNAPHNITKYARCNDMVSCVLGAMDESDKAKISSAAVLLGLTPVILATMGPSLAEVSLLSSRRPFLSLLLGVSSPSVFFERFASYSDPLELLRPVPGNLVIHGFKSHMFSALISVLEYVFCGLAVVNVVTNSIQLGEWSVLSWKCATARMVLLWALLPVGIHLVAAVSFNISKGANATGSRGSAHKSKMTTLKSMLLSEVTLSANRPKRPLKESSEREGILVVSLQWVATLFGFVHILFGTMVLSGLLFIVPKDALSVVGRYMASSLVSRAVVIFEIAGLRNDLASGSFNHLVKDPDKQNIHGPVSDARGQDIGLVHVEGKAARIRY